MPYSELDLVYNRAGNLSPAQRDHLVRSTRNISWIGGVLIVAMLGLGLFFLSRSDPVGLIGAWIFAAVVAFALRWMHVKSSEISREGAVAMISGHVQREIENDEDSKSYYLHVGELHLTMEESEYHHFEDGIVYRVYYTLATRYVVSAEAD